MKSLSAIVAACAAAPLAAFVVAGPLAVAAPLPQSPGCVDYDGDGYCDAYTDGGDYDFPEPTPVCVPSPYGCPDD